MSSTKCCAGCKSRFVATMLICPQCGSQRFYVEDLAVRTLYLLILDASSSMAASDAGGQTRISLLNDGLTALDTALREDEQAMSGAQIAAINVGGFSDAPQLFLDWTDAADFKPPAMVAGYNTPLGAAVLLALDEIETQKAKFRWHDISYTRPRILIFTGSAPTDGDATWREACRRARESEAGGKVLICPIGVGNVDMTKLAEFTDTSPRHVDSFEFCDLFPLLADADMNQDEAMSQDERARNLPPSAYGWEGVTL